MTATAEFLLIGAIFVVLGGALLLLGRAGKRGSIGFALGGWTEENSTPESWRRAHVIIGENLMRCGWLVVAFGILIIVLSAVTSGAIMFGLIVVGFVALIFGPLVAVVPVLGEIERRR